MEIRQLAGATYSDLVWDNKRDKGVTLKNGRLSVDNEVFDEKVNQQKAHKENIGGAVKATTVRVDTAVAGTNVAAVRTDSIQFTTPNGQLVKYDPSIRVVVFNTKNNEVLDTTHVNLHPDFLKNDKASTPAEKALIWYAATNEDGTIEDAITKKEGKS